MGLFGEKLTKEEKMEREIKKFMAKYNLDDLDPSDLQNVRNIQLGLMGSGMSEMGALLSFTSDAEKRVIIAYEKAIYEQNWIIINQLDRIGKALAKRTE